MPGPIGRTELGNQLLGMCDSLVGVAVEHGVDPTQHPELVEAMDGLHELAQRITATEDGIFEARQRAQELMDRVRANRDAQGNS